MALILIGLFLWWEAHLFKSAAPGLRAVLTAQLGPASKAIFALQILAGVVLMVIGYKQAEFVPVYDLGAWTIHLNNLLMLLAVILFGTLWGFWGVMLAIPLATFLKILLDALIQREADAFAAGQTAHDAE